MVFSFLRGHNSPAFLLTTARIKALVNSKANTTNLAMPFQLVEIFRGQITNFTVSPPTFSRKTTSNSAPLVVGTITDKL